MKSPVEVSEPRKPKKVSGERLRNLELELSRAVTLLDANGKLDSFAAESTNRVGDEVAMLYAGKLVEWARLKDVPKRYVVTPRHAKLE